MSNLKLIRETLDEENTFRYVLSCDGHMTDFKKDSKLYDYAGVQMKDGCARIMYLTNTAQVPSEDITILRSETIELSAN